MMFGILAWLALFYLLYLGGKAIYNVYFHPLSKFPGPWLWAASPIPYCWHLISGDVGYKIKDFHEKYGNAIRTAPDELTFTSAAAVRDIYTRQPAKDGLPGRSSLQKSSKMYFAPPGGVHSIVTVKDDADHSRYRRLLSHAFSDKALREQEPLITPYVDLLISRLHENANKGAQDMVSWFNFVAFDIIGSLTLGESFGCLEDSALHPWVSILFGYLQISTYLGAMSNFPMLKRVLLNFMPKKVQEQRLNHFLFSKEKVEKRMAQGTERPDFMSNVLKHNDKEVSCLPSPRVCLLIFQLTGMSKEEIYPTFAIILVAGSETTGTLLANVTYHLCKYPEVLSKLTAEIRGAFNNEDEITMVSVNSLKYELAVLEEALRILPPAPNGGPRVTPPEGVVIDGQWVPGGTSVTVPWYSAHRLSSNWRDADQFVPERWLGYDRYKADNRGAFAPFSAGPRNCIGVNLAYAEMRLILARLIWNFDLVLDEKSRRWVEELKMFLLWEKQPLFVKLTPVIR